MAEVRPDDLEPCKAEVKLPQPAFVTRGFRYRNEATRDRDVLRYLHTWEAMFKPVQLRSNILAENGTKLSPASCPDTALAAFAQLAAIRTGSRRCLVSLTCAVTEWILADCGPQTALQYTSAVDNPYDSALTGCCNLPRPESVGDLALHEWRKARKPRNIPDSHDHYYTGGISQHVCVFEDIRQHTELKQRGLFRLGPWIRFHCSVPLRDATGAVIGSLTVLDDKPRYGISVHDLTLLEDLADTIVEHLSGTLVRARQRRGERVVAGLGLFHSGDDSLRDWWVAQDDARVLRTGRNADKGTDVDRQNRVDDEFGSHLQPVTPWGRPATLPLEIDRSDYFNGQREGPACEGANLPQAQTRAAIEEARHSNSLTIPAGPNTTRPQVSPIPDNGFNLSIATASTYARAANLIREVFGIKGVAFVNASNVTAKPSHLRNDETKDENSDTESSEHVHLTTSDEESSDSSSERSRYSKVQGISIRNSVSAKQPQSGPVAKVKIPENYLQRLIERCPRGFVCYFDQHGRAFSTSESSESSSGDDITALGQRDRKEYHKLGKIFPGARVLTVYPVLDNQAGRWRSCVFAWTETIAGCLDQDEQLASLKTFSNSLIMELSRLESIAAGVSKTTFISSISHELRSPLHGILAGVEFLRETPLSDFQQEMTHTINVAGKTLLDTVNHVLDYSKITGATGDRGDKPKMTSPKRMVGHRSDSTDAAVHVDLAQLTEDVVETVVTAHRLYSNSLPSPSSHDWERATRIPSTSSPPPSTTDLGISVCLNITPRRDWTTVIQPGSWTRILTNLVGNAIKYTPKGQIMVHLSSGDPMESSATGSRRCPVQLTIEDTGIGMSDTFLTHGLYLPFQQEDPYSEGTGLGLSIVKQIAKSMKADLDVKSTPGKGTTVNLRATLDFVSSPGTSSKDDAFAMTPDLKVDRLHLLGGPESQTSPSASRVIESVSLNASQWLQCQIAKGTTVAQGDGSSICGIAEADLIKWRKERPDAFTEMLKAIASQFSHLLIFSQSIRTVTLPPECEDLPITPILIHQPIGPQKLLRTIASDRSSISSGVPGGERSKTSSHGTGRVNSQSSMATSRLSLMRNHSVSGSTSGTTLPTTPGSSPNTVDGEDASDSQISTYSRQASTVASDRDAGGTSTASTISRNPTDTNQESRKAGTHDTVLLVEDNEVNMKLLVTLITKLKVRHQCATNGLHAVQQYTQSPQSFFLIFMDMSMPVMDGYTATAEIRQAEKRKKFKPCHIIALTGVTDALERQRAFDSGVNEFHVKPIKMREVKELISAAQSRRSASDG